MLGTQPTKTETNIVITIKKVSLLIAMGLLTACSAPKDSYYWDNYQTTVYQYSQLQTNPQEQLELLKKNLEKASAKNLKVPPGVHAHMGMLYSNMGQMDNAFAQFKIEKELFPESAVFMDYLMSNKKGAVK